jgi:hypothetical protein
MGVRNGKSPNSIPKADPNYNLDPFYPASYVQHLHVGFVRRGDWTVKGQLHHIYNWAQDERAQVAVDNMVSRGLDESYIRDGKMHVFAAEAALSHPVWGLLAVAGSRLDATDAYTLKGVLTFAGEGNQIADRWLGDESTGTGTVDVLGLNYSASIARMLAHPRPFDASGPDVVVQAGAILAASHSKNPLFDGRVRWKAGLDVMVICLSWLGLGLRADHVSPSSKDHDEDFQVIAPRLIFKSNWNSRENVTLMYARWFYGDHSHPEFSSIIPPRLDDQLVALSANMWW